MTDTEVSYTRDDIKAAINEWLGLQGEDLPVVVKMALSSYVDLLDHLDLKSQKMTRLLGELRRSFGIIPKSEKRKNVGHRSKKRSKRVRLEEELKETAESARKHDRISKRKRRRMTKIKGQLQDLDDIILSPEEEAEVERDMAELDAAIACGGSRSDLECALPDEALLQAGCVEVVNEEVVCDLPEEDKAKVGRSFYDERTRIDMNIEVVIQKVLVEKGEVSTKHGKSLISASTAMIGPPKKAVTWNFLTNLTVLCGQYSMPFNRFATMLTTDEHSFSSSQLAGHFSYVAERLCPIYLTLVRQLADSSVFSGDDTSTRTIEVSRALENGESKKPWDSYSSIDRATNSLNSDGFSLAASIGAVLGFVSSKKDGACKLSFNTSVVSGRTNSYDPRSSIVLFRSHFGSFGDLVTKILECRSTDESSAITVLSDLASVNKVEFSKGLAINYAGCTSHARRRWAKIGEEDVYADSMLQLFCNIYHCERMLDIAGRNTDNVLAVRQKTEKRYWEEIKEDCESIAKKWSKQTLHGDAARYIIKNFKVITRYLDDPRLPMTNDFSERMLRPEKLIQANSMFRQSLEGRFALDIVRTMLQTSIAANVNAQEYLNWLLPIDPGKVSENPEKYTPRAYLGRGSFE